MTEIKLNEAALAAAEKALLETVPMYCDNNSASRIVRAYALLIFCVLLTVLYRI